MRGVLIFLFALLLPLSANAATCSAGYYLNNGVCTTCSTDGYYCPGDDTRHACPDAPIDFNFDSSFNGHAVNVVRNSWGCGTPSNVTCCGVYGSWASDRAWGYYSMGYNQSYNKYLDHSMQ